MSYMQRRRVGVNNSTQLNLFDWSDCRAGIGTYQQATILEARLMARRKCSLPLARAVIAAWALGGRDHG